MVLGYFFVPWGSQPREMAASSQGYSGSATSTGNISRDWAAGIATAWTLDSISPVRGEHDEVTTLVDGTTLYVAATNSIREGLDVAAVDISGSQPQVIWDSSNPNVVRDSYRLNLRMASIGDRLIVGNSTVDKATGEVQEAPWVDDAPLTVAGDVLVTCSGAETCTGWTWESSEWKQQWKSITSLQEERHGIWDRDQAQFFDTSGTLVDSFQVARYLNEIVRGGQAPTLEELQTYLKTGRTPWATGTVEVSGRKCEDVTVSTTSGGSSRIVHDAKGLAIGSGERCTPDVTEVRMSTDGAAVYIVNGGHVQSDHVYFLDTDGDVVHENTALTNADQLTWAFDDLVIAISKGQVTAFTPASA